MATEESADEGVGQLLQPESPNERPVDNGVLKRKASQDEDGSAKRPRRPSSTHDLETATQEEKKRGRRLFGGLLSTLSQTGTQQNKRRQEIDRRQQERIQKQREEGNQLREEQSSRIRAGRMVKQIGFEEDVMRNRHTKLLSFARLLKTKSHPTIYYLPRKTTSEQEEAIDEQLRRARATIAREQDEFELKRERHIEKHGRRESATEEAEQVTAPAVAESSPQEEAPQPTKMVDHDPHDESGDVLVEADEDMVIY